MTRGIVVAIPARYEQIAAYNLLKLRRHLGCTLPIEIWEVGREISEAARQALTMLDGISWRNVANETGDFQAWQGFQIKAWILRQCRFDEVLIVDADAVLYQNPEILFSDKGYSETGLYLFRDLASWKFNYDPTNPYKGDKFTHYGFLRGRREWLRRVLGNKKPANFPVEWDYIWDDALPSQPVHEALSESGVVVFNKRKQARALDRIFALNRDHRETYQWIWGDKETFWIGALMADANFTLNPEWGYHYPNTEIMAQNYGGKLFYTQKGEVPRLELENPAIAARSFLCRLGRAVQRFYKSLTERDQT